MKKIVALMLMLLTAGMTGCSAPSDNMQPSSNLSEPAASSAEAQPSETQSEEMTYLYDYQGMMGTETAQLVLMGDGVCRFSLVDNPVIKDVYVGSFTADGDTVTITGLTNENPDSPQQTPGLWPWIVDGAATVTLNADEGSFLPADAQMEGSAQLENGMMDVPYASVSASQVCDIYLPEGVESAPVILLIHGGGFKFGDQKMPLIQPVISAALEKGYAVVSVDYRKSDEAVFPAAVADVKAAVRFVRANAAEYGFDAENIAVWGESAGGYLALMTALTPEVESLDGDVEDNAEYAENVDCFVSFYPPVEFYTMYDEAGKPEAAAESFESDFLGQDIMLDRALTDTTYWETYADSIPDGIRGWIQAGTADSKVPYTQSQNFAERLTGYIGEENVSFGLLEGADHEDAQFYTPENLDAVFSWLDEGMKGDGQ